MWRPHRSKLCDPQNHVREVRSSPINEIANDKLEHCEMPIIENDASMQSEEEVHEAAVHESETGMLGLALHAP